MPNLFSIIGESWDFCRKQPALTHVILWLMFIPGLFLSMLADAEDRYSVLLNQNPEAWLIVILGTIAFSLLLTWGSVCVLSVGKRLLQAKSGRTRTSFKTVRSQAAGRFMPFILTSILRGAFTIFWTLLLIVPGLIYATRTAFYAVIVVCEGMSYREALKQSKNVVSGKFWSVLWSVLGLQLLTMAPAQLLGIGFGVMSHDAPVTIVLAASTATSIVFAFATTLNLLSMIQIYAWFRPSTSPVFR